MPTEIKPAPLPAHARFAIVVSQYNRHITGKLLDGAVSTLTEAGITDEAIHVAWAPGAFELPILANQLARGGDYVAVICLGAVIRGETTHDQHINRAVSQAFTDIGLQTGVPVLFGVLTCQTLEQAIHRSGGNKGNKGVECAEAALQVAGLLAALDRPQPR